jgi:hypothetical protein
MEEKYALYVPVPYVPVAMLKVSYKADCPLNVVATLWVAME